PALHPPGGTTLGDGPEVRLGGVRSQPGRPPVLPGRLRGRLPALERVSIRRDLAYVRPNMRAFKKKELVGNFKNPGREWQPVGEPAEVNVYDFPDKAVGKAIPYGIYDVQADEGWVGVGGDHD